MSVRIQKKVRRRDGLPARDLAKAFRDWATKLNEEAKRLDASHDRYGLGPEIIRDHHLNTLGYELQRLGDRIQRGDATTYISVVQDVSDKRTGKRKIRTLRSFGRDTEDSRARATHFMASFNAALKYRNTMGVGRLDVHQEILLRQNFGESLGMECLQYLIDNDELPSGNNKRSDHSLSDFGLSDLGHHSTK